MLAVTFRDGGFPLARGCRAGARREPKKGAGAVVHRTTAPAFPPYLAAASALGANSDSM